MIQRRFPIGAEPVGDRGTHFRVWAPLARALEVVERPRGSSAPGRAHALEKEAGGYFAGFIPGLVAGDRYSFRLDRGAGLFPDPASRHQPEGVHGPSEIVDPTAFVWSDAGFRGAPERGQVLYEMHVGTFTPEGTYQAAARHLGALAELGVTTLELMPLSEFAGEFGWGYDGVDVWAPTRLYGTPDDLRRFIDRAHALGLAVILDVVYNHVGPDGCYLREFSDHYFTDRYQNEWGEAIDFDGEHSAPVRELFVENARYWIAEYHFDGLRLDATQMIIDRSPRHVIADIVHAARAAARDANKRIYVSAENEPQEARLVADPERGGYGCDALWNDDFHHTARVAATGRREAYYRDYLGSPQELISALRRGYLYQGQHYYWQNKRRGEPALGLEPRRFVTYLQNHDQVANSLDGARLTAFADPALVRALTTAWLLAPATPMLFQGQEFGASAPFLFFADHVPELARKVAEGRRTFLEQFPSVARREASASLHDPADRRAFERCKLDHAERERHAPLYALHADLLALRKRDPTFAAERADQLHGALLGPAAFLLRYVADTGDRLLIVNLGSDLRLEPAPEPLLAPPPGARWELLLSSEAVKYGGKSFVEPYEDGKWTLTARSTCVLMAMPDEPASDRAAAGSTAADSTAADSIAADSAATDSAAADGTAAERTSAGA